MKEKAYVIDTNIILQNIQNLKKISDNGTNIIVVPETVLLELEDKKKLTNELGYYSREFARMLAKMKIKEVDYKTGYKVVKYYDDNLNLNIITKDKYDSEMEQSHLSESNDKRIIEAAVVAQEYYNRLAFMKEMGVAMALVSPEDEPLLSDIEYNMKKEIEEKVLEGFVATATPTHTNKTKKDRTKKPRHRKNKAKKEQGA